MIKAIYYAHSSFFQVTTGGRPSWAWRGILHWRQLLIKGLRLQVRNGKSVRFWQDRWIPQLPSFSAQNPPSQQFRGTLVADFINQERERNGGRIKLKRPWGVWKLRRFWRSLWPKCQGKMSRQQLRHYSPRRSYSVNSGYWVEWKSSSSKCNPSTWSSFQPPTSMWKLIWQFKVPSKVQHFWWKVCRNCRCCQRESLQEEVLSLSSLSGVL